MELNFNKKIVLVTGGTRGIGKAIVEDFLKSGAFVITTGTSPHHKGGKNLVYVQADFDNKESIEIFLSKLDGFKKVDICINNAGINIIKQLSNVNNMDYDKIQNINLKAPYCITKIVSEKMKKEKWGRIVNISSIYGNISKAKRSLYTTTKAGLIGLTKASAIELAAHNILVNSVSPGFTLTDLTKKSLTSQEIEELSNQIPLQRFADTQEISKLVLFLCSDLNTYITGQNIIIDGGFTSV